MFYRHLPTREVPPSFVLAELSVWEVAPPHTLALAELAVTDC